MDRNSPDLSGRRSFIENFGCAGEKVALLRSGNANNSANAGFAYLNTNNTAANADTNIGAQLSYNFKYPETVPTWQKITNKTVVLVTLRRKLCQEIAERN
jgi:hypothetical protein